MKEYSKEELFILFKNFLHDSICEGNYDNSKYWDKLRTYVIKKYNFKIWDIFYKSCDYFLYANITEKEFFNKVLNIPNKTINKILGAGSNGIVYKLNNNKVIKVYYDKNIKSCDRKFLEWCLNHNSKVFPKVYKIGKNWCVLEKLKIYTPKVQRLLYLIDNTYVNGKTIYNWITKEKNVNTTIFNIDEKWAYDWCKQCQKEMEDMKFVKWPGDLTPSNIGERSNGDIIFFDV